MTTPPTEPTVLGDRFRLARMILEYKRLRNLAKEARKEMLANTLEQYLSYTASYRDQAAQMWLKIEQEAAMAGQEEMPLSGR